jgi:hypothetical protein
MLTMTSQEHLKRIEKTFLANEAAVDIYYVDINPLSLILGEHNVSRINYLSIDIEGGELDVLETLGDEILIDVILCEDNYNGGTLFENFLAPKGYIHFKKIEQDSIFVHERILPL